jgi:acyl carrier protein
MLIRRLVSGGVFMTSMALNRSFAEASLASQICTFIARYLKVDAASIDAHSDLTDDFGLDLLDITELMIVLEQQFCTEGEITDEPKQIELVADLIQHIEQHHSL